MWPRRADRRTPNKTNDQPRASSIGNGDTDEHFGEVADGEDPAVTIADDGTERVVDACPAKAPEHSDERHAA